MAGKMPSSEDISYLAQLTLELRKDVANMHEVAHKLELTMAEMGVAQLRIEVEEIKKMVRDHEAFKDRGKGVFWLANGIWALLMAIGLVYLSSRMK